MRYLIILAIILSVGCETPTLPEKSSSWKYLYNIGDSGSAMVYKNEFTGTCILFYQSAGVIQLPEKDCQ